MNLWNFYLYGFFPAYLIAVPLLIFIIKPDAPSWKKSCRTIFLIFLLPLLIAPLSYVRTKIGLPHGRDYGCWIYNLYFFLLFSGISVIYVGWWEYAWRRFHKQTSWKIIENFQYGFISNAVIFISAVCSLYFILILAGCKYCGMGFLLLLLSGQKFVYFNIIPLAC